LSVPDFDSVQVRKITTDSAEALHADPTPPPPHLVPAAHLMPAANLMENEPPLPVLAALALTPTAPDHHQRGRELLSQGHLREAIEELSEAIREQPGLSLAYNARGFAHYLSRDYRQAVVDLDEAIRLNPNYRNAYQIRSQSRKAMGDRAGSVADAQKARALAAGSRT
jgi:tetratricopeptide (TPR) repeat protein